jgi:phage tail sheath protein FI
MEVYDSTQWAKSENMTSPDDPEAINLMTAVATQIDSILESKKTARKIYAYKPTVCDETNNTPESMAARILNTRIRVRPTYPADYIDHSIQKIIGNE